MKNKHRFILYKDRLAQYKNIESRKEYWERYWTGFRSIPGMQEEFKQIFKKYLHPSFRILEAGCGIGKIVKGLHL